MTGETDLGTLLSAMAPHLHAPPYGYVELVPGAAVPAGLAPFAAIAEDEGMTLVAPLAALAAAGLAPAEPWARITLTVHSALAAVGLTAAFATALAARGISANVVAGYHHDHIFVQWDRQHDALAALQALSGGRNG